MCRGVSAPPPKPAPLLGNPPLPTEPSSPRKTVLFFTVKAIITVVLNDVVILIILIIEMNQKRNKYLIGEHGVDNLKMQKSMKFIDFRNFRQ